MIILLPKFGVLFFKTLRTEAHLTFKNRASYI